MEMQISKFLVTFLWYKFALFRFIIIIEIAHYPEGHETRKVISGCLKEIEKKPDIAAATAKLMEPWFNAIEKDSQRK